MDKIKVENEIWTHERENIIKASEIKPTILNVNKFTPSSCFLLNETESDFNNQKSVLYMVEGESAGFPFLRNEWIPPSHQYPTEIKKFIEHALKQENKILQQKQSDIKLDPEVEEKLIKDSDIYSNREDTMPDLVSEDEIKDNKMEDVE